MFLYVQEIYFGFLSISLNHKSLSNKFRLVSDTNHNGGVGQDLVKQEKGGGRKETVAGQKGEEYSPVSHHSE